LATIFDIDNVHGRGSFRKTDNSAQTNIVKDAEGWNHKVGKLKIFISSKRIVTGLFERQCVEGNPRFVKLFMYWHCGISFYLPNPL
jgi:hypothetical protein